MVDITAGCTITDTGFALGQSRHKKLLIVTAATADSDDIITLTPTKYGVIESVFGTEQGTPGQEQPTWVVSTGVITLGGSSNDNIVRVFEVTLAK